MRRELEFEAPRAVRLVEFTQTLHLGGTEVQLVELMRSLPSHYTTRLSVVRAQGPLLETLREMGIIPEEFPMVGSVMRFQTLLQVAKLAVWLRYHRIELVHAHDFYSSILAVPAARLAGAKVIVGRLDLAHWHNRTQRAVLTQLTRAADHVVVNAEAIRAQLEREEHLPHGRITLIHNGLDLARFDARMALPLEGPLPETHGEPVIVHVANMNHPVKRQEDLLEALATLHARGLPAHVFFVGGGPRKAAMEALAVRLDLQGSAHFLGHRMDVPALYARADVGVLCSYAEGLSNAVMEGLAASLPMVVTRVGGNPDLVQDGISGRLVEPRSPMQLAAALEDVLKAKARGKKMGAAGRAFVHQNLTLAQMVRKHDELYQRVLA